MLLGVIADDFTGASDIANTIAKGGLATTQFLGLPSRRPSRQCEAGIISLKSRSIRANEAVEQSLAALDWLRDQGCRQFVFKFCSTFDSTKEGNIGPVAEALAQALGASGVAVCPAFPDAGRTVYQGHLFVGDRLLNESGLENHPLNPMTDPDIRRWLKMQSRHDVGLVPWQLVTRGAPTMRQALDAAAARGELLVIVDAVSDQDLVQIGLACRDAPLICGGSGVALGLPNNFRKQGLTGAKSSDFSGKSGPEAILAGSCSRTTLGQVAHHSLHHPVLPIDVTAIMGDTISPEQIVAFIRQNEGNAPLVYSSSSPDAVAAIQRQYGREPVAHKLDAFFAACADALVKSGVQRLVVAGGETSGAVVSALKLDALTIGPEIDPGVPALAADGRNLVLALKSGNFGAEHFFKKALEVLEGRC
jgi:uncharacterized protein YgbK (DUF1537 family)